MAPKDGFTGKERDAETGWDYFGARYYNPTIARWMNVDPLSDKYPSHSPYNYVANNPLSYIDPDGEDYTLAIDHVNRTITVRAIYLVPKGDAVALNSASAGIATWNQQSGKFSYVTKGDDGKEIAYSINFDLQVQEVNDPIGAVNSSDSVFGSSDSILPDIIPEKNAYLIVDDGKLTKQDGTVVNGTTTQGLIKVESDRVSTETGAHEIGHSLGVAHQDTGLMTVASNDPKRSTTIGVVDVNGVIRHDSDKASSRTVVEEGQRPTNLDKGRVIKND